MNRSEEDEPKKPFLVQRRRLGKIRYYREDTEYGFIEAEDYRDDVFFHRRAWEGLLTEGEKSRIVEPQVEMWVEFELDDEQFATEKKLRAKVVRPTKRPEGKKLSGRDATFQITTHHPNARKKRPTWRG